MFSGLWRKKPEEETELEIIEFELPRNSIAFSEYYDRMQEDLEAISGMDELLAGMLVLPASAVDAQQQFPCRKH